MFCYLFFEHLHNDLVEEVLLCSVHVACLVSFVLFVENMKLSGRKSRINLCSVI